jgi:Uri superfamily endonuclease
MNSLIKRIERHLSHEKKMHWHIDYLLNNKNSEIDEVLFNISTKKIECELAKIISKKGEEIPKFGSSDCNCNSHLIYFKLKKDALCTVKEAYINLNMEFNDSDYFKNDLLK